MTINEPPVPHGAEVLTISIGPVSDLRYREGMIRSAFVKRPVPGIVLATTFGLSGDQQGDRIKHGGRDKAICAFPAEHYSHYEQLLGRPIRRPGFGENLTTAGLTETNLCIGDTLRMGTAVLQVTLPRNPCYRLAARHGVKEFPRWFERSGRTGFYLRVLESGQLGEGCRVELSHRPNRRATVAEANRVMHHDKRDWPAILALLAVPELGDSWRRTFEQRMRGQVEDPTRRRYGPIADAASHDKTPARPSAAVDRPGSKS